MYSVDVHVCVYCINMYYPYVYVHSALVVCQMITACSIYCYMCKHSDWLTAHTHSIHYINDIRV